MQSIADRSECAEVVSLKSIDGRSSSDISLKVITAVEDLACHTEQLEELAQNVETQNVSYLPWVMFPILRACASSRRFLFVLVFDECAVPSSRLIGFFPLERVIVSRMLPLSCLRLWADPFNYLNARCDPLIRKGHESCINLFIDWFSDGMADAKLLNLRGLTDGTALSLALAKRLSSDSRLKYLYNAIKSHLYRCHDTYDAYLNSVFSRKSLQTMRRNERRLRDLGLLQYSDINKDTNVADLLEEFLQLEHRGWKGRQGVSIIAYGHEEIIKRILLEAHSRGRLSLLTLRIEKKLIAARCVLLAQPGSFLFKLTYDEDELYAKRSPGLLLEIEAIRRMHNKRELLGQGVEWMDTCASPYSSIFIRSRSEPLTIGRYLVARRGGSGAFALDLIRYMQMLTPSFRRYMNKPMQLMKAAKILTGCSSSCASDITRPISSQQSR